MLYYNFIADRLSVVGTDPFFWIGDPDPDSLCILLCDPFPDPDPQFITRSFPDPDPDHGIIYIFN